MQMKNILDVLFDINKCKRTCFLCFKQNDETVGLHEEFHIQDEITAYDVSLFNIFDEFHIDVSFSRLKMNGNTLFFHCLSGCITV